MSIAVIIGVGDGLSASLARQLSARGHDLVLAARNPDKLAGLADATGAKTAALEATDAAAMGALFDALPEPPRIAIYNPSARVRGPLTELDPEAVRRAVEVTALGGFYMGQAAARAMLTAEPVDGKKGTILFTGASAGVKGFPQSASFAMGKFAQRGLAQSMSRELHPQGIHVAWINIDGGIRKPGREDEGERMLDPEAIAQSYLTLIDQPRSAWSEEIALRPWVEKF